MQVAACVEYDAAKPGGEPGLAAEGPDPLDQNAADVLGDVIGIGTRSGQLPGKAMDPVIVPLEQQAECLPIARKRSGQQVGIGIVASIRHGLFASPAAAGRRPTQSGATASTFAPARHGVPRHGRDCARFAKPRPSAPVSRAEITGAVVVQMLAVHPILREGARLWWERR